MNIFFIINSIPSKKSLFIVQNLLFIFSRSDEIFSVLMIIHLSGNPQIHETTNLRFLFLNYSNQLFLNEVKKVNFYFKTISFNLSSPIPFSLILNFRSLSSFVSSCTRDLKAKKNCTTQKKM